MKKQLTLVALIIQTTCVFSQLRVYPNGNVALGTIGVNPLSRLTIGGNGNSAYNLYIDDSNNGMFCRTVGGNKTWRYGANMSSIVGNDKTFFVGVSGNAVSSDGADYNNGRAFGVIGTAGNATSGWNYGVFGRLTGEQNGAAVYGSTGVNDNGRCLKNRYAGYFNGKVSVRGDLTVRGYIDGLLLSPSLDEFDVLSVVPTNLLESNGVDADNKSVSETLSSLNAVVGTKNIPDIGGILPRDTTLLTQMQNDGTSMELQYNRKKHYALLVEEIEEVYPDLVYTIDDGEKVINYVEMIPLLVESIKELKAQITELQGNKIGSRMMSSKSNNNQNVNETTDISEQEAYSDVPSLSQNNPNPFANATSIKMTIPQSAATALLCIYDMSGKQISQKTISDRGEVTYSFTSEGMDAGMYLYSLIIDGKLINTRRMILTK